MAVPFLVLIAFFLRPVGALAQDLKMDREVSEEMLDTVVKDVEKNFYDPTLKGVDWKPLVKHAHDRIENAQNHAEMFTAIFSLVNKLDDSHTIFLPPSRVARIKFGMDAMAFGDEVRIWKIKKDGAADKAGLKVGDRIVAINNFQVTRKSYDTLQIFFRLLRPSQVMDIQFVRGTDPPQAIRLEGDMDHGEKVIDLTDIDAWYKLIREMETEERDEEKEITANYQNGTGYIKLTDFEQEQALIDHMIRKVKNSRTLIVDLRRNPGGSVDLLKDIAGYFEAEPTIIGTVETRKKTEDMKIKPHGSPLEMPLFILVDSKTASAGEIFARHFQKNGRAKVIGDMTAQKVNVARIFAHHSGTDVVVSYALELAVGRLVFPGGEELEKRGVTPDQLCIPTAADQVAGRDPCLDMAKILASTAVVPAAKP